MKILTVPNEILISKAEDVLFHQNAMIMDNQSLANEMIRTAIENDLYGLAAPQVGQSLRIFVVDMNRGKGEKKFKAFFNPTIKAIKSGNERVDRVAGEEGCASIPGTSCVVKRWNNIKVFAQDENGNHIELNASGMLARIFQHESDHLNGILMTEKCIQIKQF